jgi:hypothetical protein
VTVSVVGSPLGGVETTVVIHSVGDTGSEVTGSGVQTSVVIVRVVGSPPGGVETTVVVHSVTGALVV